MASLWGFILLIELSSFSLNHPWGPKVRAKPENLLKESFGDEQREGAWKGDGIEDHIFRACVLITALDKRTSKGTMELKLT